MRKEQDYYFKKAKKDNYPARSVYKLEEAQVKYRFLRPGQRVRMESAVFESALGDAIQGRVDSVVPHAVAPVADPAQAPQYEVRVAVTSTPWPLLADAQVQVRIYLGRRSLWAWFLQTMSGRRDAHRGGGDTP